MYIYSKLACGVTFTKYAKKDRERSVNIPEIIVCINGGANVSDKITKVISLYKETEVTKEEFEFLKSNRSFVDFCTQGMMLASSKQLRADEVLKGLSEKSDGCSPLDESKIRQNAKDLGIKDNFDIDPDLGDEE